MFDSDVVTFQHEMVVIRTWNNFPGAVQITHGLIKTRWNWPVSSISRSSCATLLWKATVTWLNESLKKSCCPPKIHTSEGVKHTKLQVQLSLLTYCHLRERRECILSSNGRASSLDLWIILCHNSRELTFLAALLSRIFSMHSSNIIIHQSCFTDSQWDAL